MKLGGRKPLPPQPEVLVIPRPSTFEPRIVDGQPVIEDGKPVVDEIDNNIVFMAQQVASYDEFNALVPPPEAPLVLKRGQQVPTPDFADRKYLEVQKKRSRLQTDYMILKSLQATPDLQWETVDMNDPETWHNWETELREGGLSDQDASRVVNTVAVANSLNEEKYNEAKKSFLAGRAGQK